MSLAAEDSSSARHQQQADMRLVSGGTFRMGSDRHYPEEVPVHRVTVDGFWIDRTPVTNRRFREFVAAIGYVTFAEVAPDPKDYPGALPHMLQAGSLVFDRPDHPVDLRNLANWWSFKFGANWRRPYGEGSSIRGLDDHPVVHIAYRDAEAYVAWVGKQLPTEAEWKFAARGGLDQAEFAWGDQFTPCGRHMANTWQGEFPCENLASNDYARTAPVDAFSAEKFRPLRHDRQCLGVDRRLVFDPAYRRRAESFLHSGKSARRDRGRQLRPIPAADQNSPQGCEGRLTVVGANLLPPVPAGRPPCSASRHVNEPCPLQVHNKNRRSTP